MTSRLPLFVIPFTVAACCGCAGRDSATSGPALRSSFCGRVVAIRCYWPSRAVELQLAEPSGRSFRAVIPPTYRRLFGDRIEERYDQQWVCALPATAATPGSRRLVVQDPQQLVVRGPRQAAAALPDDVVRSCDADVRSPTLVRSVPAQYTARAMRAKVRGSVFLRGIIDRNGAVRDAQVVQALEPSLDEAARRALAQWEFRPATLRGEPVVSVVNVQMAFTTR